MKKMHMKRHMAIPTLHQSPWPRAELFYGVIVESGGWTNEWLSITELHAALDRWVKRSYSTADPRAETDGGMYQCGGCRWFAAFDSDYGLCTHAESPNDGRVVFEHGGCSEHSMKERWE